MHINNVKNYDQEYIKKHMPPVTILTYRKSENDKWVQNLKNHKSNTNRGSSSTKN